VPDQHAQDGVDLKGVEGEAGQPTDDEIPDLHKQDLVSLHLHRKSPPSPKDLSDYRLSL
jgi:hypothetical protein